MRDVSGPAIYRNTTKCLTNGGAKDNCSSCKRKKKRIGLFGNLLGTILGGGGKPTVPDWNEVSLAEEQIRAIEANQAALPGAESLVSETNRFTQDQIRKMLQLAIPNYDSLVNSASGNIGALLRGEVPQDVSDSVQRSDAAKAISGGYSGSGMHGNLVARDLGLTSLNAIQAGLSSAQNWIQVMDRVYAPGMMDVSSMFITPMQQFSATFANKESEWGVDWMKNQIKAMPDPFGQALGQFLGGIGDAAASYFGGSGVAQVASGAGQNSSGWSGAPSSSMGMGGGSGGGVPGGMSDSQWSSMIGSQGMSYGGGGGAAAAAGGGGGGAMGAGAAGCCFIFLESYNGKLPWWVRVCRDYYYWRNPRIATGYKRMAKWIVPLMQKSAVVRKLVESLMVTPITKYGGWMCNVPGYTNCQSYAPYKNFWFSVWHWLGGRDE